MFEKIKRLYQRPTLFLVLGTIAIVVSVPLSLWFFSQGEGYAMVGAALFNVVWILIIVIFIDRLIVRHIGHVKLSIIQAVLLLFLSFVIINQVNSIKAEEQGSGVIIIDGR